MKKTILNKLVFVIMSFALCAPLIGCGDDDTGGDAGVNPENKKMVGTKWTFTDGDFSFGDDWVGTSDVTFTFYFYSNTEGLFYYSRKDWYSDIEASTDRAVAHFSYDVSGNKIELDYITDFILGISTLTLNGDMMSADGIDYIKGTATSSDNEWLATLHGTTGECKWYHDLKSTLWIVGEGKMTDYDSFEDTPWYKHDRIPNKVVIDGGVTSVGAFAFANPSIGEVDMPYSSMMKIGAYAFSNASISEIFLGEGVEEIGEGAFSGCTYLNKVYLREGVETVGDYAFSNCKEVSLGSADNLKKIGRFAFSGCKVGIFTSSKVLEEVGEGAFTNISVNKLVLPNSLKTLGHMAFDGNIGEIHVGTGLRNVDGTPFYPNKTGKIYVNLGVPLELAYSFLDPASGWTLYVPEGSKAAYSKALYWKEFKSIVEDASLETGNGTPDDEEEGDDGEGGNTDIIIPETYTNSGAVYKWVKVESPTMPTFYIMQTELDPHSHFRINDDVEIGILDANGDNAVIKSEFRHFLETIKEATGIQVRLPTREEWMYAASGGNKSQGYTYSGSDDIDEVAWYRENSSNQLHDFAQKKPNELGLYDMCGNYGDLCNDDLNDVANVDGNICGGCFSDAASSCKITSYKAGSTTGKIPGIDNIKEKNAFDARKIAVRLVFTEP